MSTIDLTKEEKVETYPEIYTDKRPWLRYTLIGVAVFALVLLSAVVGATLADDAAQVTELEKQNAALQTKVDDTITQRDEAQEEAAVNEEAADYVDSCRSAGKALATVGVERNDMVVRLLESGTFGEAQKAEVEASNDAFAAAVAQLKLCDPSLTASDIGLTE